MNTKRIAVAAFVLLLTACGLVSSSTPTPEPTLPNPGHTTTLPPNPEGTASAFLNAWAQKDYAGMYSLLSPLSQAAISQEDFVARYTDAADQMTLKEIETGILSSLQKDLDAELAFRVTFHTALVGDITRDITMPLRFDGARWVIAWDDGLILPELKGGNSLFMDYKIPSRANIYDRNGLAFAAQTDAVAIGIIPGQITDESTLLRELSTLLGRHPEVLKAMYQYAQPDWYVPMGEASAEEIQARYSILSALGGLVLNTYQTRYYLNGSLGAAHAVGYIFGIPAEEADYYRLLGYRGDERVGTIGLEAWGEKYLAGKRGGTLLVVTPGGQVAATLAESESAPGQAVYSTLDREFQKQVAQAMGDLPGAAVVLNINTGEVLAFVSSPSFDPNLFDYTNYNSSTLGTVLDNPYRPLINRVTQGLYPPGSVFKVVNVAAALKSGLFERDTTYTCTGVWDELGANFIKYDWTVAKELPPHGEINLPQALTYSCNTYNYHIGFELYNEVDPEYLPKIAREFGLGRPTGIVGLLEGTNEEVGGIVPDAKWKQENIGEEWSAGDHVNMAIGQGYLQVTPLQMAVIYAAIGNGGTLYRPQLVSHIAAPGEEPSYEFKPEVIGAIPLTAEQLDVIREGLRGVVTDRNGTARNILKGLQIPVWGKTGTAEDPFVGRPHAWFIGYTQANRDDKPDIVVAVILQNRGEGSEWAAPVFRRIVESYFFGRSYVLYPWESDFGLTATPTGTPDPNATATPSP
ncbi:MAG TPA: penicillin-binding transpeptidase domain-containing protein [Anaerolineales bacterium]|nr:penicillin-binding transpeptidase domain-containing protein [Anaerolineales bacterium]